MLTSRASSVALVLPVKSVPGGLTTKDSTCVQPDDGFRSVGGKGFSMELRDVFRVTRRWVPRLDPWLWFVLPVDTRGGPRDLRK